MRKNLKTGSLSNLEFVFQMSKLLMHLPRHWYVLLIGIFHLSKAGLCFASSPEITNEDYEVHPPNLTPHEPSEISHFEDIIDGVPRLQISPQYLNKSLRFFLNPHQILMPTESTYVEKLALFLPGTAGTPKHYINYLKQGALQGFHVIGLMYANEKSPSAICNLTPSRNDILCFEKVRERILFGVQTFQPFLMDEGDSIERRFTEILTHLSKVQPGRGWEDYLRGCFKIKDLKKWSIRRTQQLCKG